MNRILTVFCLCVVITITSSAYADTLEEAKRVAEATIAVVSILGLQGNLMNEPSDMPIDDILENYADADDVSESLGVTTMVALSVSRPTITSNT